MDQQIINLYDEYTHKPLDRQEFLKRLARLAGGMTAALGILPLLESNYAKAAVTNTNDFFTERIKFKGHNDKEVEAYVVRPKAEKKYDTILVIHENRGLTPHIEDVARRVASAGYLAVAPNALSVQDKKPANEDEVRQLFQTLDQAEVLQHFITSFSYLKTRHDSNGRFGAVGFCWGGAMANKLAVNVPDLRAAVAFYGRQPEATDVSKIKAAVQLHYASLDQGVNAGMAAYEEALKANNIRYEQYVYDGVNHAFHNDTSAARYNEAAAKLAWQRTLDFFQKYVRS